MALKGLLDRPDYHVAEGSIDARGWPLLDNSGETVGRIVDFIVDTDLLEARYCLVALEGLFREVVISVKEVDFDLKSRTASCRNANRRQIEQLPYLGGTSLKPEDEHRLYAAFLREDGRAVPEKPLPRMRTNEPTRAESGFFILTIERRGGEA